MAASTKTDYSPSVPDPSTLVGPGGVEHHIVRVRGLPWSCTENELIEFFEGVCIQSVHFTRDRDGRPSGDAYMVLASLKDQKLAHKFHKAHMGNRYLEVFEARYSEMSWMLTKNVDKNPKDANKMAEYEEFEPESDAIIKMRGLPFEAGPAEIIRFFDGTHDLIVTSALGLALTQYLFTICGSQTCQWLKKESSSARTAQDDRVGKVTVSLLTRNLPRRR